MKDGRMITILKILPINFNLKSELEKQAILEHYKNFLKNLNSKVQIIISSRKVDIKNHISKILESTKENPQLYEMSLDYIELINNIIANTGTYTKDFYIVIPYTLNTINEISKIKNYLTSCGNEVYECKKDEIINIFQMFLNKRQLNLI